MKLIQFVFVLTSGAILLFSCTNGTKSDLSTQQREETKLSELSDYNLKGKVRLIKQEEFLSSIDGQLVGSRTGLNSLLNSLPSGVKVFGA